MPPLRIFRTASFRLSALYGVVFAACFLFLMSVSYWTVTGALQNQIRIKLQDEISRLAADFPAEGAPSIIQDISEKLGLSVAKIDYYYFADAQGRKLAGNIESLEVFEGWRETPMDQVAITQAGEQEGEAEDHRLWGLGQKLADGSLLFVGQDAYQVLAAQEAIVESFAWSAGVAFLLAALAGIAVSQKFLKRIDQINTTSQAIIDGNLKERIPVHGTADEIDRLSANLNRLLDSNQALMESLKQVSTNIAHDLRTPLSRLRQVLEQARMGARDGLSSEATIDAAIIESDQLLATFSALLRIAQIESGTRKAGFKPLSLSGILEHVASAYRAVAEDQNKQFTTSIAPEVSAFGDRELLMQMIANLVENAITHTPPGTPVSLRLESTSDGPIATVADAGPGIPAEQHARVFERFYRLDASRSTAGNGLGMAMAAAVAALHGIGISLHDNQPGLKVVLRFSAKGRQTV